MTTLPKMAPDDRCMLINRVIRWCHDNCADFGQNNIGSGLAYLCWAIADDTSEPFDVSVKTTGVHYAEFVKLLKSNPNGLWDTLVAEGVITDENE